MSNVGDLIASRYRLVELIGGGAMGSVWLGRDEVLHREVAVKLLLDRTSLAGEAMDEAHERARREARITARLHHPNAVTVYDVVEQDGAPVLVMEYVPGSSLATVLATDGPLPPAKVAGIGAQVAAALAEAHRVGVVHRDIKPGNVLIAPDGKVKLVDFGISRAVGDVVLTATGLVSGTPAYLAPEIAGGATPTPESDVFALGATLYAAVEGEAPFGGANTMAVLYAAAAGRVRPPQRSGPLTPVLAQLLQVDPAARPSLALVADRLITVAGDEAVPPQADNRTAQAALPPPPARPARPTGNTATSVTPAARGHRRRNRAIVVTAVGAAVVVGVALTVASMSGNGHQAAATGQTGTSTQAPLTTSSTPGSPTIVGAATAAQIRTFIRAYYALLPGDTAAAWQMLSPRYQRQTGLASFQAFYGTIASVRVIDVNPLSSRTARANLEFVKKSGGRDTETYRFDLIVSGGHLLIDNATLVNTAGS